MMEEQELAMLQAVADLLKEYAPAVALSEINSRIGNLEAQVKAIPAGPKGDKGDRGESIRGDRGEKGDPGESIKGDSGKDGIDGKPGVDGKNGIDGKDGAPGEKGIDGKDGRDGRDGKDGRDGEPGRDALQIEILSAIDPTKGYPRGTFAQHDGGLIRSRCNTAPGELKPEEWDVILRGSCGKSVAKAEDGRTAIFYERHTCGQPQEIGRLTFPVMIYREIYRDGIEYEQGDVVTYDGCAWHCSVETTKGRPGSSTDWKMMVRKGNAGKDGGPGPEGPKGKDGRDGRDLTQIGPDGRKH